MPGCTALSAGITTFLPTVELNNGYALLVEHLYSAPILSVFMYHLKK